VVSTANVLTCLPYFQGKAQTLGERVISQCLLDFVQSNVAISLKLFLVNEFLGNNQMIQGTMPRAWSTE
jgi:hypothetical protein